MSVWQMPAPPMRTSTSPGPGVGSSTSTTSGGCFQSTSRTAFIASLPAASLAFVAASASPPPSRVVVAAFRGGRAAGAFAARVAARFAGRARGGRRASPAGAGRSDRDGDQLVPRPAQAVDVVLDVGHDLPAGGDRQVDLAEVADDQVDRTGVVVDRSQRVVGEHLVAAQVQRRLRPGHVGDADVADLGGDPTGALHRVGVHRQAEQRAGQQFGAFGHHPGLDRLVLLLRLRRRAVHHGEALAGIGDVRAERHQHHGDLVARRCRRRRRCASTSGPPPSSARPAVRRSRRGTGAARRRRR